LYNDYRFSLRKVPTIKFSFRWGECSGISCSCSVRWRGASFLFPCTRCAPLPPARARVHTCRRRTRLNAGVSCTTEFDSLSLVYHSTSALKTVSVSYPTATFFVPISRLDNSNLANNPGPPTHPTVTRSATKCPCAISTGDDPRRCGSFKALPLNVATFNPSFAIASPISRTFPPLSSPLTPP